MSNIKMQICGLPNNIKGLDDVLFFGNLHKSYKTISQQYSKIFVCFIVAIIVFNSIVPKFIIKINSAELSKIMASQSLLTDFFYNSTLPVKIVNKIVNKYLASQNSISSKTIAPYSNEQNKTENTANNSSESAILKLANNSSIVKKSNNNDTNKQIYHALIPKYLMFNDKIAVRTKGLELMCIFVVMFFFLLPRSSISVDKIIRLIKDIRIPIWRNSNWVFYLLGFTILGIPNSLGFKTSRINSGFQKTYQSVLKGFSVGNQLNQGRKS